MSVKVKQGDVMMTEYGTNTGLEKLSSTSKNILEDNKAKIAQIFPQVLTESRDADGKLRQMIDFDKLKELLSDELAEGRESYEFTWVGKRDAMAEAGRPTTKTLRPDLEESVNFDETGNVFISGDNLEVLKILQESYLNKIDMIYIDPPYNTGKDFVYADNFAMTQDDLDEAMDNKDETGQRLFKNERSNARYHSDWLNMMYPRLVLARNLLKESGVIFISIDDNEQSNLKQLCDEVFGEENFIANIMQKHRGGVSNDKIISDNHNFILFYTKNRSITESRREYFGVDRTEEDYKKYTLNDNDGRGSYTLNPVTGPGGARKGNPFYEFLGIENYWRFSKERMQDMYDDNRIVKRNNSLYQKTYRSDMEQKRKGATTWWDNSGTTSNGTNEIKNYFSESLFDFPKPTRLIKELQKFIGFKNAIILDFFAGSATTADAVMQLNAEDGGNRKYILCTLDEEVNEKSAAKEAGYETIDQISRERIRRAAKKIKEENPDKADNLDLGFRAYCLDSSNYKDVYLTPDEIQQNLFDSISNIKDGRTGLDLLNQVMLTWGMPLDLTIDTETVGHSTVYNVDDDSLIACFDQVDEAIVRQIAQKQPLRAIFRDESFANSSDKINVSEIFKELSPETKVKVV